MATTTGSSGSVESVSVCDIESSSARTDAHESSVGSPQPAKVTNPMRMKPNPHERDQDLVEIDVTTGRR